MSNSRTWVVFDFYTKAQSKPLTKEELQMAILKMRERDWERFFLWTHGWKNWQPLREFLCSEQRDFLVALTGEIVTERTVKAAIRDVFENEGSRRKKEQTITITKSVTNIRISDDTETGVREGEQVFDGDEITWSDSQPPTDLDFEKAAANINYRKRAERHELKLEILLITLKGKTYRSYSRNISLTGSLLEDNIPFDYYGVSFDVVIVNRHATNPQLARVQLKGQTIGDGLTQRVHFPEISDDQKDKLTTLLDEYVKNSRKSKKPAA